MVKKTFNAGKALSFAFTFACRFPKYVLVPWIVMMVISFTQLYLTHTVAILKYIPRAEMTAKSIHYSIGTMLLKNLFTWTYLLVIFFFGFIILSGYIRMIKKWLEHHEEPTWKDFFTGDFPLFFKFIIVTFMFGIFSMVGLLLLIVPGIVIILTYAYVPYILIDHHGGVVNAFGRSADLTRGVKLRMFLLGLLYALVIVVPNFYLSYRFSIQNRTELLPYYIVASLLVGLIGQVFQLTMTYLYLDLSSQAEQV